MVVVVAEIMMTITIMDGTDRSVGLLGGQDAGTVFGTGIVVLPTLSLEHYIDR